MKILAIDTATASGSIALLEDGRLIAELTTCIQETHAERLLPSIKTLLHGIGASIEDVDGFALAAGPGSFTGLRIGLSTIKGLAWSLNKKVVCVSTLEALAMNLPYSDKQICPLLDARKKEVYAGIYKFQDASFKMQDNDRLETCGLQLATCLMPDAALSPEALIERITKSTIFLGDGLKVYGNPIKAMLKDKAIIAPEYLWTIKASNIGLLAWKRFKNGDSDSPQTVELKYLRPSEAELKMRKG
ncbi:MAG: tRNA (adenosine(37)-N6)-threonylcarbamoyltransferase complex dimerization subunit type 1 TsaB [Deltaproteobacteria bacterium]|nr:tRNA (adenosine(37)-N6)-threonylcarbamoyltransferase complex dimerization subunit type 1 TsaB [Deltaproteobacteria bacterium]